MKRKTVTERDCREVPVFTAVNEAFSNFIHQRLIFCLLFYQEKSNNKDPFFTSLMNRYEKSGIKNFFTNVVNKYKKSKRKMLFLLDQKVPVTTIKHSLAAFNAMGIPVGLLPLAVAKKDCPPPLPPIRGAIVCMI